MSLDTVNAKCDKCKQVVPISQTRSYHLTLRTTNINSPIDKIVLCRDCDAARHTTPTRYVSM